MVEQYCYPMQRKALGDYYEMLWRCAKCAYCRNVFPSDTEHERFGRQCPSGDRFKFESYFASGRNELARRTIEGQQTLSDRLRHIVFTCTTCGACEEWCQATQGLYPLQVTMAMRHYMRENDDTLLAAHEKLLRGLRLNHNRLNRNNHDRLGWLTQQQQSVQTQGELAYFVGCRSAFGRSEVAWATLRVLKERFGQEVVFLSEERCCGRPLLDMGEENLAKEFMQHNLNQIHKTGARRVVFSCAECFDSFRNLERYGLQAEFETLHLSQLLEPLLADSSAKPKVGDKVAVFHDPCHLGRHQGVYQPPRQVLAEVRGLTLRELPRNRKNAWCCGAGGTVVEAYPEFSHWTAAERMEEVRSVGAQLLITSCPGCKNNLWGLARAQGVEIMDLAEVLAHADWD